MNKKELEQEVLTLEKQIEASKNVSESYQQELVVAQKTLADINKPELTSLQFDNLYEAVESGVSGYDFSDSDNFELEYGIDYDNRITLETHDFRNSEDLVEAVVTEVTKLFTEKLDITEPDNHA